ncbi:MAG: thioredoxin [Bdellovibrionales bacterium]
MSVKDLTNDNFDAETDRPGLVLIDFWAEWCGPCKAFAPIYEAAAEKHPDILFAKVNTEAEPVLAQQFEIRSIPTLLAVKDGEITGVKIGALPPPKLEEWIRELQR